MKQLLIICTMLVSINTVNAQGIAGASRNSWEGNEPGHHKTSAAPANEFVNTEMTMNNKVILFSDLPEVNKPVYAVITNGEGEMIKQSKISTDQNSMDIKKLHSGLYFVTIVYRNKSKKAFTLNL